MVLIEANSIVIRNQAINEDFKGGYDEFLRNLPNKTHCTDMELERVGFMVMDDLIHYANYLISRGLKRTRDFAIVHMLDGIIGESCPWLEFARLAWFEGCQDEFTFGWLNAEFGGKEELIASCPRGWSTFRSIKGTDCTTEGEFKKRFQLLKDDDGLCTYRDRISGGFRYVGRIH